ncbi:hypothetical protein [Streptomyces hainanensis]|uniref:Uncharacterized protein n=1 Tax=Streptomyces hainanensis TaxID=402648 RepID=A0A4R4TQR0_9ACTN|nr:hypothetical protein [Streptomyces hainanensis]TDC77503.1 hypothetical protein E1283_07135 [Streptomyces hainanensis]
MCAYFSAVGDLERRPSPTRPFGLDALTLDACVDALPLTGVASVDPDTQLSTIDGRVCLELPDVWRATASTDTSASPRDGMEDEDEDSRRS